MAKSLGNLPFTFLIYHTSKYDLFHHRVWYSMLFLWLLTRKKNQSYS